MGHGSVGVAGRPVDDFIERPIAAAGVQAHRLAAFGGVPGDAGAVAGAMETAIS